MHITLQWYSPNAPRYASAHRDGRALAATSLAVRAQPMTLVTREVSMTLADNPPLDKRYHHQAILVTAVVCTRNRGESIVQTVETILANSFPCFELLVVDQSTDERTAVAVARFCTDERFRYIRSATKGLGAAHNIGLRAATADVVVITDDDCAVPPDWLEKMYIVFTQHPAVAVAFCNVAAAPHDSNAGFIPAYLRSESCLLRTIRDKLTARGIGAGMAVRRLPVLAMGGFDESLGCGAIFPSCDDGDIAVRALLRGHQVFETASVEVTHYGYRAFAEGRDLSRRDWVAIGAAYSKPLKAGYWRFWIVPAYEFFIIAIGSLVHETLRLKRPRGFTRVAAFISGFVQGIKTPIDRETLCFRPSP
jgi:glycosyltransferase involved in cell wall biosynthesis